MIGYEVQLPKSNSFHGSYQENHSLKLMLKVCLRGCYANRPSQLDPQQSSQLQWSGSHDISRGSCDAIN